MKIIGLCGMSGSGKTLVGDLFASEGFFHIDCDILVHEKLYQRQDVRQSITEHFGAEYLTDDGVDRKKLGKLVFGDEKKLALLNDLLRKAIREEVYAVLEKENCEFALLDAPTLFEAEFQNDCACVIGLIAPKNTCIERIMSRDGITKEAALSRLSRQKDEEFLRKHCNFILENNGNIVALTKNALRLAEQIKKEYSK